MKQISEMPASEWKQAWETIYIAFATPVLLRTAEQLEVTTEGLCWAFDTATNWKYSDNYSMEENTICYYMGLFKDGDGETLDYWFETRDLWNSVDKVADKNDLLRATYAAMILNWTPKQFIAICKGKV